MQIDSSVSAVEFAQRLGATLKFLRKRRKLTQADVAELLGEGVAVETVSRFERGAVAPSLAWLARLAEIYGTSLDALYAAVLSEQGPQEPVRAALHHLLAGLSARDLDVLLAMARAYAAVTQETSAYLRDSEA